jgi:lipopolysaccharide transport system ATP-binding protein
MQPLYFAVHDDGDHPLATPARNDEPLFVVVRADVRHPDPALCIGFTLFNQDSQPLLWSLTTDTPEDCWPQLDRGFVELRCAIPSRLLNQGTYRLELNCSLHCREWLSRPGHNSPAIQFEIQGGLSDSPYWFYPREGVLAPEWRWERTA